MKTSLAPTPQLRRNLMFFGVLFAACLLLELFFANYRDLSIGNAPRTEITSASLTDIEGGEVLPDGSILIYRAGASLTFSDVHADTRAITVYTAGAPGTVNIASCSLTDDASRYDFQPGGRLYFHPGGGHFFSRAPLTSSGELHDLRLDIDRARDSFTIQRIVLNEKRGFHFDKLRFLCMLVLVFVAGACRRFRLTQLPYEETHRSHRLFLYGMVTLCLLTVLWIYRALSSFGAADPIPYPLETPVESCGAYVQQFDAFQKGQLHLDVAPDSRLSRLQNPYDFSERVLGTDGADWKQPYWDRAYYNGHYYSYFGIGPLLAVYYPYYWITGSLPGDATVSLIFSAASVLLLFGVFEELRRRFLPRIGLVFYGLGFAAAFFCGLIPLAAVSSCFYYIAVNGAQAFFLLFFFLFLRAFSMPHGWRRTLCAFCSGVSFVFLVLCRPNAALAAVCAAAPSALCYLLDKEPALRRKLADAAAFLVPVLLGAAGIMCFNFLRFDSPFEFGTSYQLTVSDITWNSLRFDPLRIAGYLYYYLLQPFGTELCFPFLSLNSETIPFLGNYMYHAASVGLFALPIFLFLFLFLHRSIDYSDRCKRFTYVGLLAGGLLVSYLNYSLGGVFIRYLCDVSLPLAILALLLALEYAGRLEDSASFARRGILLIFSFSILIGGLLIFSNENMALLNDAPETYLRIMDLFRM